MSDLTSRRVDGTIRAINSAMQAMMFYFQRESGGLRTRWRLPCLPVRLPVAMQTSQ